MVKIKGKIASLLEVGTGFNGELTGRENVYLNGAILGMKKRQIDRKLDEIIAFSGIEHHMDTPVKRYSSGMFVRLGFAVAAHLDSDILIADEVLAVGDAEFQKKALGKMEDLSTGQGRTVLFVSHNLSAVKTLCKEGILLASGRIECTGTVSKVIEQYTRVHRKAGDFDTIRVEDLDATITSIKINSASGSRVVSNGSLEIEIQIYCERSVANIGLQIVLTNADVGGVLFVTNSKVTNGHDFSLVRGKNRFMCRIKKLPLCAGYYRLGFGIDTPFVKSHYYVENLLDILVEETFEAPRLVSTTAEYGRFYMDNEWKNL